MFYIYFFDFIKFTQDSIASVMQCVKIVSIIDTAKLLKELLG
jgi:hypothetical protein